MIENFERKKSTYRFQPQNDREKESNNSNSWRKKKKKLKNFFKVL